MVAKPLGSADPEATATLTGESVLKIACFALVQVVDDGLKPIAVLAALS
jgi:hypothetical protein